MTVSRYLVKTNDYSARHNAVLHVPTRQSYRHGPKKKGTASATDKENGTWKRYLLSPVRYLAQANTRPIRLAVFGCVCACALAAGPMYHHVPIHHLSARCTRPRVPSPLLDPTFPLPPTHTHIHWLSHTVDSRNNISLTLPPFDSLSILFFFFFSSPVLRFVFQKLFPFLSPRSPVSIFKQQHRCQLAFPLRL